MSIRIRGTLVPQQQRYNEHFSPTQGTTRTYEWKSFDPQRIINYAAQYGQAGCEYQLDIQHNVATLVATDNSGNLTIDVWEIGVNEILVSSLRNPLNVATVNNDDSNMGAKDTLLIIKTAIEEGLTLDEATHKLYFDDHLIHLYVSPFVLNDAGKRLYSRMKEGFDSFFFSQYVLRHTTNVSNAYSVNVADSNIDLIYSAAQLLSEATNAASWILPLPGRLVYKIQNIPTPAVPTNYMWGWLKSASSESTAANNRVNIVTEYKLGLISTDEYTPV